MPDLFTEEETDLLEEPGSVPTADIPNFEPTKLTLEAQPEPEPFSIERLAEPVEAPGEISATRTTTFAPPKAEPVYDISLAPTPAPTPITPYVEPPAIDKDKQFSDDWYLKAYTDDSFLAQQSSDPAFRELERTSINPQAFRLRSLNRAWLERETGQTFGSDAEYDAVRNEWSLEHDVKPVRSDEEFAANRKTEYQRTLELQAASVDMIGRGVVQATADYAQGRPTQMQYLLDDLKKKYPALSDPEIETRATIALRNVASEVKKIIDPLRPQISEAMPLVERLARDPTNTEDLVGLSRIVKSVGFEKGAQLLELVAAGYHAYDPEGKSKDELFTAIENVRKSLIIENLGFATSGSITQQEDQIEDSMRLMALGRGYIGDDGRIRFQRAQQLPGAPTPPGRPLTGEEVATQLEKSKEALDLIRASRMVRDALTHKIDPKEPIFTGMAGKFERGVYSTLASTAFTAGGIVAPRGIGDAFWWWGTREMELNDLLVKNPGLSRDAAKELANWSATYQAPFNRIQAEVLFNRFPRVKELVKDLTAGKALTAMGKLGLATGVENINENFQNYGSNFTQRFGELIASERKAASGVTMDEWSALSQKAWNDTVSQMEDTFWGILPMMMIGAGVNLVTDPGITREELLKGFSWEGLLAQGLSEEQAARVMSKGDIPAMARQLVIEHPRRTAENMARANAEGAAAQAQQQAEAERHINDEATPSWTQRTMPDGTIEYTVRDPEGNVVRTTTNRAVFEATLNEEFEMAASETLVRKEEQRESEEAAATAAEAEARISQLPPEEQVSARMSPAAVLDFETYEQPAAPEEQARVDALNVRLAKEGFAEPVRAVAPLPIQRTPAGSLAANFIQGFQQYTGRAVQFIASESGEPLPYRGVVNPADPSTIFLDAAGDRAFLALLGHEWSHTLKGTNPKLYAAFIDAARPLVAEWEAEKTRIAERAGGKYKPEQLTDEIVGNIIGDAFAHPEFLKRLAQRNPTAFEGLVNFIKEWFAKFIDAATHSTWGTEALISDINAMHDLIIDMMETAKAGAEVEVVAPTEPAPLTQDAPIAERKARARQMWANARVGDIYSAPDGFGGHFKIEIKANKDGTRYAEITSEEGKYVDTIDLDKADPTKGQGLIFGAEMTAARAAPEVEVIAAPEGELSFALRREVEKGVEAGQLLFARREEKAAQARAEAPLEREASIEAIFERIHAAPAKRAELVRRAARAFAEVRARHLQQLEEFQPPGVPDEQVGLAELEAQETLALEDVDAEEQAALDQNTLNVADRYADRILAEQDLGKRRALERQQKLVEAAQRKGIEARFEERRKGIAREFTLRRQALRTQVEQATRAVTAEGAAELRRLKQVQTYAELNAILKSLPPDIRGRIPPTPSLAGMSDEQLTDFLVKRITQISNVMEFVQKRSFIESINDLLTRYKPKRVGGVLKTRIGDAQQVVNDVKKIAVMDNDAVAEEQASIEAALSVVGADPLKESALLQRQNLLRLFGDMKNQTAAELEAGHEMLRTTIATGRVAWAAQEEARLNKQRAQSEEIVSGYQAATGVIATPEGVAAKKRKEGIISWAHGFIISHFNFSQFLKEVLPKLSFLKEWETRARRADGGAQDYTRAATERFTQMLIAATGSKTTYGNGDAIRKMQEATIPSKDGTMISQLQAIHYLMAWGQSDVQERMIRHGWTQAHIEAFKAATADPVSQATMAFLRAEYDRTWNDLNPVHRRLYGTDMPKIIGYAPTRYEHQGLEQDINVMGAPIATSGMTPSFVKARVPHDAQLTTEDAMEIYLQHMASAANFIHYAELVREIRGTLNDANVKMSLKQHIGRQQVDVINRWVDALARGGNNKAAETVIMQQMIKTVISGKAIGSLILNPRTIAMQVDSALRAMMAIPTRHLASMVMNPNFYANIPKVWHSDTIQRRVREGMSPESRYVMDRSGITASRLTTMARWGLWPLRIADGMFTSISSAAVFTYHYNELKAAGLSEDAATKGAADLMDEAVHRFSQPTGLTSKSMWEVSGGPTAKVFMLFMSDPRLKTAMLLESALGMYRGENIVENARKFASVLFMAAVSQTMVNFYRDWATDDDDDEIWTWGGYMKALALAPFQGFFMVGAVAESALAALTGEQMPTRSPDPLTEAWTRAHRSIKNWEDAIQFDDPEKFIKEWDNIMKSAGILYPPAAGLSGLINVTKAANGVIQNIENEEE